MQLSDTITRLNEVIESGTPADQLLDVFTPVRSLVEGESALVQRDIYERMRTSDARVIASVRALQRKRISIVSACRP